MMILDDILDAYSLVVSVRVEIRQNDDMILRFERLR